MKVHSLWFVCIAVRICLILLSVKLIKDEKYRFVPLVFLSLIGMGFLYKAVTGSNNETQVAKVFWHETRIVHSALYLLAAYYCFKKNTTAMTLLLSADLLFSISYRFVTDV